MIEYLPKILPSEDKATTTTPWVRKPGSGVTRCTPLVRFVRKSTGGSLRFDGYMSSSEYKM